MKKIYYLIIAAMLSAVQLYAQETKAQEIKMGVKAGTSLAVINNTLNTGADIKTGPLLGVYLDSRFNDAFSLQSELQYSSQGCKTSFYNGEENGKIELGYINLALIMKLYVVKGFHLAAGPQAGLLISAKETYRSTPAGSKTVMDVMGNYKSLDAAFNMGLGYQFEQGFNVGVRYSAGLTNINANHREEPIRKQMGIGKMTNRVIQLSVGYSF